MSNEGFRNGSPFALVAVFGDPGDDRRLHTPDLKRTIVDGVLKEAANRPVEQLAKEENALLVGLINLRTQGGQA